MSHTFIEKHPIVDRETSRGMVYARRKGQIQTHQGKEKIRVYKRKKNLRHTLGKKENEQTVERSSPRVIIESMYT